jgi:hypothetical protein
MKDCIGVTGTITYDTITHEEGETYEGLGGILYQAAVLCGIGKNISLITNLGQELVPRVNETVSPWSFLEKKGMVSVPGPGNRVFLHYPNKGEREEILKAVVPPLSPPQVFEFSNNLKILVSIFNSGFDIRFQDWRSIVDSIESPIWLDVHSLVLEKELNLPRRYFPFPDWKKWVSGITYLQANKKEVCCMLGRPEVDISLKEVEEFGSKNLELGVKAVFVTLGKEGVLIMDSGKKKYISAKKDKSIIDTTGCGDVFCAATVSKLTEGFDVFDSAEFGVHMATKAAGVAGIKETYDLVKKIVSLYH